MKFGVLFPHLEQRQQRLLMRAEARLLGHGGIRAVARAASVSETTVRKGVYELEAGEGPLTVEGRQHPGREAQFRYINDQAKDHISAGDPVISVDSKKKDLVGQYKNAGREWQPAGDPVQVKTHDFLDREGPGKAIPYGIYDIAANTGWVRVGTDHDTAAFAV